MKKITLLLLLSTSLSFAQAFDGFDGIPGESIAPSATGLPLKNGWGLQSSVGTPAFITAGSLTYTGLINAGANKIEITATGTEDVNLGNGTLITGAAYCSGLFNFQNSTGLNPTGDFFFFIGTTLGGNTGTNAAGAFDARLYIRTSSTPNKFNLGIYNNSTGATAISYSTNDYDYGTTLFIVVKYDLTTTPHTASLFVNPTIGQIENATPIITHNLGTAVRLTGVGCMGVRQTTGTGNIQIDEVRMDATWSGVTDPTVLKVAQNDIAGLNVYPNPVTNGNLYITSNSSDAKSVAIFDVLGKQVVNSTTTNNAVNVSQLKGGVYILQITENGNTATRKLIIE